MFTLITTSNRNVLYLALLSCVELWIVKAQSTSQLDNRYPMEQGYRPFASDVYDARSGSSFSNPSDTMQYYSDRTRASSISMQPRQLSDTLDPNIGGLTNNERRSRVFHVNNDNAILVDRITKSNMFNNAQNTRLQSQNSRVTDINSKKSESRNPRRIVFKTGSGSSTGGLILKTGSGTEIYLNGGSAGRSIIIKHGNRRNQQTQRLGGRDERSRNRDSFNSNTRSEIRQQQNSFKHEEIVNGRFVESGLIRRNFPNDNALPRDSSSFYNDQSHYPKINNGKFYENRVQSIKDKHFHGDLHNRQFADGYKQNGRDNNFVLPDKGISRNNMNEHQNSNPTLKHDSRLSMELGNDIVNTKPIFQTDNQFKNNPTGKVTSGDLLVSQKQADHLLQNGFPSKGGLDHQQLMGLLKEVLITLKSQTVRTRSPLVGTAQAPDQGFSVIKETYNEKHPQIAVGTSKTRPQNAVDKLIGKLNSVTNDLRQNSNSAKTGAELEVQKLQVQMPSHINNSGLVTMETNIRSETQGIQFVTDTKNIQSMPLHQSSVKDSRKNVTRKDNIHQILDNKTDSRLADSFDPNSGQLISKMAASSSTIITANKPVVTDNHVTTKSADPVFKVKTVTTSAEPIILSTTPMIEIETEEPEYP